MLSKEENEILTRVGPGTPMGEVLRRYWMPALLSWELPEPDCPPVRVRLLGEDLIAFKDTRGRIGLLDEFCAHRSTSLWLGRNEENGLRCVWHGWKYDVTGQCVEQLNEPGERSLAAKIRLKAYPTLELGGVIWAYMGPPEKQPPPPRFGWTQVPETHREVTKVRQECNWVQALEGGIDQSHVGILHRRLSDYASYNARGGAPSFDVEPTDYGVRYFAVRPSGPDQVYARGYHFVMPFYQIRPYSPGPGGNFDRKYNPGHMWVPIDDEHCFAWSWSYSYEEAPLTDDEREEKSLANGPADVDQKTFVSFANMSNDWFIDRRAQKTESYTGIQGVNTQDRAVQELQGPIVDRSKEHLGPSDRAIIAARQVLLDAVKIVEDGGNPPGTGTSYYHLKAIVKLVPKDTPWRDALLPEMCPDEHEMAALR